MKKITPYAIMLLIAAYLVICSTLPVQAANAAPEAEASMSIDATQANSTEDSEDPESQGTHTFHLPMCPCWECRKKRLISKLIPYAGPILIIVSLILLFVVIKKKQK